MQLVLGHYHRTCCAVRMCAGGVYRRHNHAKTVRLPAYQLRPKLFCPVPAHSTQDTCRLCNRSKTALEQLTCSTQSVPHSGFIVLQLCCCTVQLPLWKQRRMTMLHTPSKMYSRPSGAMECSASRVSKYSSRAPGCPDVGSHLMPMESGSFITSMKTLCRQQSSTLSPANKFVKPQDYLVRKHFVTPLWYCIV
jgi:hypothetical protein